MLQVHAQAFGFEQAPEGVLVHAVCLLGPCFLGGKMLVG